MVFTEESGCVHASLQTRESTDARYRFSLLCDDCGEDRRLTHAEWRGLLGGKPSSALLSVASGLT